MSDKDVASPFVLFVVIVYELFDFFHPQQVKSDP